MRDSVLRLKERDIDGHARAFPAPGLPGGGERGRRHDRRVGGAWSRNSRAGANAIPAPTASPDTARWSFRLKAPGVPPGDITAAQMEVVANLADRYSFGEIRATYDQNLVLADVRESDLHELWRALGEVGLATANIGLLTDMICCPGLDFCSLANARSIPIAAQINARFADLDYLHDIGELELKMSGCMNACGHHHVGHIGILGVDKNGVEFYQITLGGVAGDGARLGERLGPAITADAVADTIESLLNVYVELREGDERFVDTVARLGVTPFKDRAYAVAA
jgi:sulfite reductase (NADPH) hemoprotein beta-component